LKKYDLDENALVISLYGTVVGLLGAMLITSKVHEKSFPKLEISESLIAQKVTDLSSREWEFANVEIKNAPSEWSIYCPFSKIPRMPAYECQVKFSFHDPKNPIPLLKFEGEKSEGVFLARWGRAPEPNTCVLAGMFQSPTIYSDSKTVEHFNVVHKRKGNEFDFFIPCSNDHYLKNNGSPNSKNFVEPPNNGKYIVRITASTSGHSITKDFEISLSKEEKELLFKESG